MKGCFSQDQFCMKTKSLSSRSRDPWLLKLFQILKVIATNSEVSVPIFGCSWLVFDILGKEPSQSKMIFFRGHRSSGVSGLHRGRTEEGWEAEGYHSSTRQKPGQLAQDHLQGSWICCSSLEYSAASAIFATVLGTSPCSSPSSCSFHSCPSS